MFPWQPGLALAEPRFRGSDVSHWPRGQKVGIDYVFFFWSNVMFGHKWGSWYGCTRLHMITAFSGISIHTHIDAKFIENANCFTSHNMFCVKLTTWCEYLES